MTAGSLRSVLVLEQARQTPTGASGITKTYLPVETTWGSVRGVKEQAFADAVTVGEGVTDIIRIRWRSREGFDHVGGDAGRRWRIEGIKNVDDRRRYLDLYCVELAPEVET